MTISYICRQFNEFYWKSFSTVVSSSKGFPESVNEASVIPEGFSTILILHSLKFNVKTFSSLTRSSLFSLIQSSPKLDMEMSFLKLRKSEVLKTLFFF